MVEYLQEDLYAIGLAEDCGSIPFVADVSRYFAFFNPNYGLQSSNADPAVPGFEDLPCVMDDIDPMLNLFRLMGAK